MRLIKDLLITSRPSQWSKNLVLFAGLIFSLNLFNTDLLTRVITAFIIFCINSAAIYLINDLVDAKYDKLHPLKSKRPVASGSLAKSEAIKFALLFILLSLMFSYMLSLRFLFLSALYLILQVLYSFLLKKIVIIDIFTIVTGFVLRVIAGAVIIGVEISPWLILCTILLSLFLALCKRRHEFNLIASGKIPPTTRQVLADYNIALVDQMISVTTASTVMSYALYTMSEQTRIKFGTTDLVYTVPFVIFGIFRYLYIVHKKELGNNPEILLFTDPYLLADILAWAVTVVVFLY